MSNKLRIEFISGIFIFLFYLLVSLLTYYLLDLNFTDPTPLEISIVPADGLTYIRMSNILEYNLFDISFLGYLKGSLNWITLPGLYFFIELFGVNADIYIIFINSLMLAFSFRYFLALLRDSNLGQFRSVIFFILLQPYLISYVFVPNKEIPLLLGLFMMLSLRQRSEWFKYTVCLIIFGVFKIQIILAGILLFLSQGKKILLFFGVIFIALLYPSLLSNGLIISVYEFVDQVGQQINSIGIIMQMESIAKLPLGFLIVAPARVFLNLLAGFFSFDNIFTLNMITLTSSLTTFLLTIICFVFIVKFRRNLFGAFSDFYSSYTFVIYYLLVLSLIPFIQSRYYWFLTPILFVSIVASSKAK